MSRPLRASNAAAALLCGALVTPAAPEPLYQDLGPGITRLFLSAPYADHGRVLWAGGTGVVAKLDAATFDVVATLRRPGAAPDDSGRRERQIAAIDGASVAATPGLDPAAPRLDPAPSSAPSLAPPSPAAPLAPLLDADGRLLVPEERAIVAYGDAEPGARLSGVRAVQRFELPASIPGRFTGLALIADGHIVAATSAGWVISLARGFSRLTTVRLPHAPSPDASERFVHAGIAADDRGGLFVASTRHLHRVAWDGANLSVAADAGAWSEPIRGGVFSAAAPVLLEAGTDRLVGILSGEASGEERSGAPSRTLVVMWREQVPLDRTDAKSGAAARIAATVPALWAVTMGSGLLASTGSGAEATKSAAPAAAGSRAALEKLTWDETTRALTTAWTSRDAAPPLGGAVLSPDAKTLRYIGLRGGRPALVGLDWTSGAVTLERALGGARFHPRGAIPILDPGGALVSGCLSGAMRVELGS